MKKLPIILFISLWGTLAAQCDWYPTSYQDIDEVYVPSETNWQIDLRFMLGTESISLDSVVVISKQGQSYMSVYKSGRINSIGEDIITLSAQSMKQYFAINPQHDSIYIRAYNQGSLYFKDSIAFGYGNPRLPSLTPTTSIKQGIPSNKPKIGIVDNLGTTAVLKGKVICNIPELNVWYFYEDKLAATPNSLRDYNTSIYPYEFIGKDSIRIIAVLDSMYNKKMFTIKPFKITPQLGDTITQDIYLLDETTAVAQPQQVAVAVYPNPASEELLVAYEGTEANQLVVCSIAGQEVEQLALPAGQSPLRVPLGAHYQPGMYVACLLHNGAVVQRLRFVVQR